MPYFYIDSYYWILVVPAIMIALFAQIKVQSTFKKYNQVYAVRGLTAAEAARRILDNNGLSHIRVERVAGTLTDHFDPRNNVIRLSDAVYGSSSVGAIGVAAHEAGHAIQYDVGYFPIKIRAAMIPITNIGSSLAFPLAAFGLLFGFLWLVDFGILLFLAVVLFQLVTLPVEFNASRRALHTLEADQMLTETEIAGARRVLSAAAMTYVAALVTAVANLLRLIMIRNEREDR